MESSESSTGAEGSKADFLSSGKSCIPACRGALLCPNGLPQHRRTGRKCECKLPGWRNPALSKRSPIPGNVHKHDNASRKRTCNSTKLFPSELGLFPPLCFPSAGTEGWSEGVSAERRDSVLPNSCWILHSTFLPLGEGTFSDAAKAVSCVPRPAAHRARGGTDRECAALTEPKAGMAGHWLTVQAAKGSAPGLCLRTRTVMRLSPLHPHPKWSEESLCHQANGLETSLHTASPSHCTVPEGELKCWSLWSSRGSVLLPLIRALTHSGQC